MRSRGVKGDPRVGVAISQHGETARRRVEGMLGIQLDMLDLRCPLDFYVEAAVQMQTDTGLWRSGERARLEVSGEASRVLSQVHSLEQRHPGWDSLRQWSPTGGPQTPGGL